MPMTDDEIRAQMQAEIKEAARILREDGHSVRLSKIEEKLNKHFPDEPDPDAEPDPNAPPPPPKKDVPDKPEGERNAQRSGVWWPAGTFDEPS